MSKKLAMRIAIDAKIASSDYHFDKLPEDNKKRLMAFARDVVEIAAEMALSEAWRTAEHNPRACREEVTGLSTKGTNKNTGNSGFSGGAMVRLVAA